MLSLSYIPAPAKFGTADPCDSYGDDLCDLGGSGGPTTPQTPPSWMIGTFNGHDTNGVPAQLVISSNGTVNFHYNGTHSGFYNGSYIILGTFGAHNVQQTTTGIRTISAYGSTDYVRAGTVATNPCANVLCGSGTLPAVVNGQCVCSPNTTDPCAGVDCAGQQSIAIDGVCHCVSTVNPQDDDDGIACTTDAKICPDGSIVGRDPNNNCQFRVCPQPQTGNNGGGATETINNLIETVKANPVYLAAGVGVIALLLLSRD